MPMYFFNLRDKETVIDTIGTDLVDVAAARAHASQVARELTFKSSGFMDEGWWAWTMTVHDEKGVELFSMPLSDFGNGG